MSRRIFLIVPYRARDLEGHALVGYHLERRYGHEVRFSNGYGIERKLLEYGPDVLVLDHLAWIFKVEQARLAKKLGLKVIVLPTEGLFQGEEAAVQVAGSLHGAGPMVDSYLTWGAFQRRAILHRGVMIEAQVKTVGCPRFDFYRPPYLTLNESRDALLSRYGFTNPDAPFILWATNTTYAARPPATIVRRYVKRANWSEAQIRALLEHEHEQLREHSSAVLRLAEKHPDWNLLIKIHPAEWVNPYLPLMKQASNIRVAFDSPIRSFVCHCDVLLQRNCTTATEGWMLDKPVIQLEIGEYHAASSPEYANGNHVVRTFDEADRTITGYLQGASIPAEQRRARTEFIAEFYHQIDGLAAERCAAAIHEAISAPAYTDRDQAQARSATREAFQAWTNRENARPMNRLKDLMGIDRGTSLRVWRGLRRRTDNLGLFTPEVDITPDMVAELYQRYGTVVGDHAAAAVPG